MRSPDAARKDGLMRDSSEGGILYAPGCGRCRPREGYENADKLET